MTVALFPNHATAEPLQKRLAESGLHAEIHDKLKLEKLWFVSKAETGVRLEVRADEFERAERLLLEWHAAEGVAREAIRCPECRSLRIQYPQATQKSMMTNLFMGLAAGTRLVDRHYYCEECHYTWPHHPTPHKERPHSAPHYFIDGLEHKASSARERK